MAGRRKTIDLSVAHGGIHEVSDSQRSPIKPVITTPCFTQFNLIFPAGGARQRAE